MSPSRTVYFDDKIYRDVLDYMDAKDGIKFSEAIRRLIVSQQSLMKQLDRLTAELKEKEAKE